MAMPSKPSVSRIVAVVALATLIFAIALAVDVRAGGSAHVETYQGKTAIQWHKKMRLEREKKVVAQNRAGEAIRAFKKLRRHYLRTPSSIEAIRLAAITYGASYQEMYNVAGCETGWTFNPRADNSTSSASGLFQFLYPSTWNRTPYASESVWSPYANALAAAWLWKADGRSWREWVCKP